ncbi:MAG: ankyrin repeat domain-containing protein [Tatlockia sp.]|nr:ankyrin repeat domain-containing protein [Tatlockia sp.]
MKRKSDNHQIKELSEQETKWKDFLDAVCLDDIEVVGYFLNDSDIDPGAENNRAIREASEAGHDQMVKLLLTDARVHPMQALEVHGNDDVIDPLILACKYGRVAVVKILLADPRVNPGEYANQAIQTAIFSGFSEIVELLIKDPRVDSTKGDLLLDAVLEGDAEIVKILLEDPKINFELMEKAENNESSFSALAKIAAQHDNIEVLELLLSHSEVASNHQTAASSKYPQIKLAMNSNKFGLFFETEKKESRLAKLIVKNLAEELANAYDNSMK